MDKKAFHKKSYGLFVCTVSKDGRAGGCIINTAVQASADRVTIAVNKENHTHDLIKETGVCNISVISEDAGFALFKRFGFQSGRDTDKFAGLTSADFKTAENGIPYITKGTNAYISLKVESCADLGSHTLFICVPTEMEVLSEAPSCTYEHYLKNIKPKPEAVGKTPEGKTVWRCTVCGYEWEGEELPEDFVCPLCKHPKADFEKVVV